MFIVRKRATNDRMRRIAPPWDSSGRRAWPVRSYITSFSVDEVPLSEGGLWVQGGRDGIDWCDVISAEGRAFGEVTRMCGGRAARRAGQPRCGCRRRSAGRRLRRPDRGPGRQLGPHPVRQGACLQPQPDRAVLPGGRDPPADDDHPAQHPRLRGVLPLPQDGGGVCRDRALGRRHRQLAVADAQGRARVRRQGWGRHRGEHRRQRHQGLHQWRRDDLSGRRHLPHGQPGRRLQLRGRRYATSITA